MKPRAALIFGAVFLLIATSITQIARLTQDGMRLGDAVLWVLVFVAACGIVGLLLVALVGRRHRQLRRALIAKGVGDVHLNYWTQELRQTLSEISADKGPRLDESSYGAVDLSERGLRFWSVPKRGAVQPRLAAMIPWREVREVERSLLLMNGADFHGVNIIICQDSEAFLLPVIIASSRFGAFVMRNSSDDFCHEIERWIGVDGTRPGG